MYKIGFDHIFIIDTNDEDKLLRVYNDRVTVMHIPFYEIPEGTYWSHVQRQMYNDQISMLCDKGYEWCAIIDIDEYFEFNGYTIQEYIEDISKQEYDHIEFRWQNYTSNNLAFNSVANVEIAYPIKCNQEPGCTNNHLNWGKCLFRLDYGMRSLVHWMSDHTYSDGKIMKRLHEEPERACVKHYRTKCLNDFLDKLSLRMFDKSETNTDLGTVKSYILYNGTNANELQYFETLAKMKGIELADSDKKYLQEIINN